MDNRLIHRLLGALLLIGSACHAAPARQNEADRAASVEAFNKIAQVMRHPRCMNCHTSDEFPRQGQDSHPHDQMVRRGIDGRGAPWLRCHACHQTENMASGGVPGAAGWRLAPMHMAWDRTMTDKALCEKLKDRETNGNRDGTRLVDHLTTDHLVQWAFEPGARSLPPLNQATFHESVRRWVQTGMECR